MKSLICLFKRECNKSGEEFFGKISFWGRIKKLAFDKHFDILQMNFVSF